MSKKNVASAADAVRAIGGDPRPRSTETSARVARRHDWRRSKAEPPRDADPDPPLGASIARARSSRAPRRVRLRSRHLTRNYCARDLMGGKDSPDLSCGRVTQPWHVKKAVRTLMSWLVTLGCRLEMINFAVPPAGPGPLNLS